jgi:hypothetical protein
MAVVIALMSMLLLSALGAALVLTTSAETTIAANFGEAQAGLHAADAAVELAVADLATAADWTPILDGSVWSGLAHTLPEPGRTAADGSPLDLDRRVNTLNCRNGDGCDAGDLTALTGERPWGPNNPVWRLYAYGPLSTLLADPGIDSAQYVAVLVADDPSENDGDPLRDGVDEGNPGRGRILVRGEAFGPRGAHQIVAITLARSGSDSAPGVRVLSWHVLR